MRVALVNNFFPPRAGGSAHFTQALAQRLGETGHDVLVITADNGSPDDTEPDLPYRVLRMPSRSIAAKKIAFQYNLTFTFSPRNVRRLWRELDAFQPDVVHQHNQVFDLSLLSSAWARHRRVPVVLTIHTALIHTSPVHRRLLRVIDAVVAKSFIRLGSAHLVAPDLFMQRYIAERYRPGSARISSIPIGVDVDRFGGEPARDVRAEFGLGDRPVVFSLGHVIPLRDRLALVEALPRLRTLVPDVMVVVGGVVYDSRFIDRAIELGVRDHLLVVGGIPKDDVPSFMSVAQVESHDLQGYGLGTASLEVMAAGVPVVAAVGTDNFPGLQLRDREHLAVVAQNQPEVLADTIHELLTDPTLADEIGRNGQKFVTEHFSIERVAEQYAELYAAVAGRARSRSRRR